MQLAFQIEANRIQPLWCWAAKVLRSTFVGPWEARSNSLIESMLDHLLDNETKGDQNANIGTVGEQLRFPNKQQRQGRLSPLPRPTRV